MSLAERLYAIEDAIGRQVCRRFGHRLDYPPSAVSNSYSSLVAINCDWCQQMVDVRTRQVVMPWGDHDAR